jgi:uroporphyrinogen-III decarboxylase
VEWQKLSPTEKYNERIKAWKYPDIKFASKAVEQAYQQRVQMLVDAIELKKPERVPVGLNAGFYPFWYSGITVREAMYDYGKLSIAMKKYHTDFLPDTISGSPLYGPGKAFEILDYKAYRWPGHGVPDTAPYQFVESEYMKSDEYDLLINDPTNYFLRYLLPRTFGSFSPLTALTPLTDLIELPFTGGSFVPFGSPEVQEAFKKILEAGKAAVEWIQAAVKIDTETKATLGLPSFYGGFSKAPYDTVGDTLRGTRAIMLDKYRQPKKVLAASERLTPLMIEMGIRNAATRNSPLVMFPLHKGADNFMSREDFKTYYWPSLKAVILALINDGLIPYLFVEGSFNQRLDLITDPDIPAGKTLWMFDQTNMNEVKKHLSGWAAFGGNVPLSLIKTAGPQEVKDYVKRLIDEVGCDGSYILSTGAAIDEAKPENMHAMIDFAKEYGVYKKR